MTSFRNTWMKFRFKYTLLLGISIVAFFGVTQHPYVDTVIRDLALTGNGSALVAGMFFVFSYTVVPAGYVLAQLGHSHDIVTIALLGGLGAMVGDYLIFKFVRDHVTDEWAYIFKKFRKSGKTRSRRSPVMKVGLAMIGGIIVASPLPDEIGVSLMGISRMSTIPFLGITYLLNSAGIFSLLMFT